MQPLQLVLWDACNSTWQTRAGSRGRFGQSVAEHTPMTWLVGLRGPFIDRKTSKLFGKGRPAALWCCLQLWTWVMGWKCS